MNKTRYIIIGAIGLILALTAGPAPAQNPQPKPLSRAVIKINGLSCGGCFSTISQGLSPLEGYSGMGTNVLRKLIAVDFTAPLTPEKISQTLSEAGYPGTLETVDAISENESFAYLESSKTGFKPSGGSCCTLPGGSQPADNL